MTDRPPKVDLEPFEGITPGEWEVIDVHGELHTTACYGVIARYTSDQGAMRCEAEANAHAIAAVPALIADLTATRAELAKYKEATNETVNMR